MLSMEGKRIAAAIEAATGCTVQFENRYTCRGAFIGGPGTSHGKNEGFGPTDDAAVFALANSLSIKAPKN